MRLNLFSAIKAILIILVENGNIVSNEAEIATTFNQFYSKITETLDLLNIPRNLAYNLDIIDSITASYASHPSILTIKDNHNSFQSKHKLVVHENFHPFQVNSNGAIDNYTGRLKKNRIEKKQQNITTYATT